jgi:segregation and condensation protein B
MMADAVSRPAQIEPVEEPGDLTAFAGVPSLHEAVRVAQALLFASDAPLSSAQLAAHIGQEHCDPAIATLRELYAGGGVELLALADGWALRTAPDLAYLFDARAREPRKLSRAALETLAIIAYHQPVTRAEIEDIRGVSANKGTLDVLLETGWVRMRGRRRTPGRPVTYGTSAQFLDQFTLASITDLPGLDELKGAGLLEAIPEGAARSLPAGLSDQLGPDEDPLDEADLAAERSALALWPTDDSAQDDDLADLQDEAGR